MLRSLWLALIASQIKMRYVVTRLLRSVNDTVVVLGWYRDQMWDSGQCRLQIRGSWAEVQRRLNEPDESESSLASFSVDQRMATFLHGRPSVVSVSGKRTISYFRGEVLIWSLAPWFVICLQTQDSVFLRPFALNPCTHAKTTQHKKRMNTWLPNLYDT